MDNNCIAFIPARSGSKRIPNKNIKILAGHPLIAYTIAIAIQCKLFSRIIVSTDSEAIAKIAQYYGAEIPFLRPKEFATDESPDIDWLKYTLKKVKLDIRDIPFFSIIRPTSPFRSVSMIQNAWKLFLSDKNADSIRAVEKCAQHPAKMWIINGNRMKPVLRNPNSNGVEWYSTPMQALPPIYAQNSSLEIAKCEIPLHTNSIAGTEIIPYFTKDFEGYDINSEKDWIFAEYLIKNNKAKVPKITVEPYKL